MVEQRSSKPLTWVRFLLPLLIVFWNFNVFRFSLRFFFFLTFLNYNLKTWSQPYNKVSFWFFISTTFFVETSRKVGSQKFKYLYLMYLLNVITSRWYRVMKVRVSKAVRFSTAGLLKLNRLNLNVFILPLFSDFFFFLKPTATHSFYTKLNLFPLKRVLNFSLPSIYNAGFFFKARLFWFASVLIKFIEFLSAGRVFFYMNRSLVKYLTGRELLVCSLWNRRLYFFQRKVGFNLFIIESLYVFYLTLKIKDPTFFLNWFKIIISKINFWRHRSFLKYFRFLLLYVFNNFFTALRIYGVRFKIKGKISVAGNARKRTFDIKAFKTSYSTLNTRVAYKKDVVTTFTGVLGLKFMIFFS